jgi:hypothetical protein
VIEIGVAPGYGRVTTFTIQRESLGLVIDCRSPFIFIKVATGAFRFYRRKRTAQVIGVTVLTRELEMGAGERERRLFVKCQAVDIGERVVVMATRTIG